MITFWILGIVKKNFVLVIKLLIQTNIVTFIIEALKWWRETLFQKYTDY